MKKIMFNDRYGLTEAVLSGRKTQTRRIIPNCSGVRESLFCKSGIEDIHGYELKPRFHVGEVVVIAQAYRDIAHPNDGFLDERYEVKDEFAAGWNNKMFVRADLMPHQIRITNVRVERLQDISDEDCFREGIEWDHKAQRFYVRYDSRKHSRMWFANSPRETYSALIDRISGKGTWESNPYVFVYDFELVK